MRKKFKTACTNPAIANNAKNNTIIILYDEGLRWTILNILSHKTTPAYCITLEKPIRKLGSIFAVS
jgi:hypothetical protein